MFRVNYRALEALPLHQRDLPPRGPSKIITGNDGSWQLALMVGLYLVAMGAGLALLTTLASQPFPNTTTAEIMAGR